MLCRRINCSWWGVAHNSADTLPLLRCSSGEMRCSDDQARIQKCSPLKIIAVYFRRDDRAPVFIFSGVALSVFLCSSSLTVAMTSIICSVCAKTFSSKKTFVLHLISRTCFRTVGEAAKSSLRSSSSTTSSRHREEAPSYPTREFVPVQGCHMCKVTNFIIIQSLTLSTQV